MNPQTQKKEEDWTAPSKTILNDVGFLKRLQTYDKDNMDPKKVEKIQ